MDRYGNQNAAYDFNGKSSAITINNPHQVKFPFSVSMWVKVDNFGSQPTFLYSSDDNTAIYSGFWIHYIGQSVNMGYGNGQGGNNPAFRYTNESNTKDITLGKWHHLVASFISLKEMNLYIDGKLRQGFYTGKANSVSTFGLKSTFGRNLGRTDNVSHNGQLDDIRIYNKDLTERDRAFLFYETPWNHICEPKKDSIAVTDTLIIDMLITNVNQNKIKNVIKVFPNPTKDFITINTGNDYQNISDYTVRITNTLGQTVYQNLMNEQNLTVKLNDLGTNGLYYIQIIDENQKVIDTRKIILQ